jgi:hypothetical protein
VHSHNHCCCRKAISTTYSKWMSIASVIKHAKCMCHIIFICDMSGSTTFFHIISWTAKFQKKSLIINMCFDFLYKFCLKYFSISEGFCEILSQMCIHLQVKYPLFLSHFNHTWIFSNDSQKIFKYQMSWKSVQYEPSHPMWADRWMDRQAERQTCQN